MTTEFFFFNSQNRLIQTSQTGGQQNRDTSPISIPYFQPCLTFAGKTMLSLPLEWSLVGWKGPIMSTSLAHQGTEVITTVKYLWPRPQGNPIKLYTVVIYGFSQLIFASKARNLPERCFTLVGSGLYFICLLGHISSWTCKTVYRTGPRVKSWLGFVNFNFLERLSMGSVL